MPKLEILESFWNPESWGQTVLPDRSLLIGQKLVENAKIKKCEDEDVKMILLLENSFLTASSDF